MATRAAKIKTEKISVEELLALIAISDKNGFPMYVSTAIECTDKRTVAKLYDTGVITYEPLALGTAVHLANNN